MKTAKRITAIFLCFVMLLGVCITSASALEIGDTVEFLFENEQEIYTSTMIYAGTAKEGINKIETDESEIDLCYEFNVEKAGFYSITWRDSDRISPEVAEIYENGSAKNHAKYYINDFEDEYETRYNSLIYYLYEGISLITVYVHEDNEHSFKIEYFADSITDVKFKDETDKILFRDYGIDLYEDYLYFYPRISIEFSNSKTIEDYYQVKCPIENELVKGENTVTMLLPGFEKEITILYYETSDFVESIELGNIDNYLNAIGYYNNDYYFCSDDYDNEQVTVYFKDGTEETITFLNDMNNYITFPCGVEVYIDVFRGWAYDDESGVEKLEISVYIGGTKYIGKEYNVENASFKENVDHLNSEIKMYLNWMDFDWWISEFLRTGNVAYLKCLAEDIGRNLGYIFDEILMFINYYI